jgi:chorismate-pyruvate lyase
MRADHDQLQTPELGGSLHNGDCKAECDCGDQPCGEYIFDHRNNSFAEWFINSCELVMLLRAAYANLWAGQGSRQFAPGNRVLID